ncbi:hypothetical protein VB774_07445 [Pseudanabaena galeata UHCC 0370]|uniref:Uncharacterized protein n=1 Tax=Pseudanabaena galeata UHCC 0370 TaxID=3110310 RepID=A0ABU5TGS2_9CYAN|nr:hypothetical protein [Pseudanabaena galeata]MEA5477452.1 hypothetical protein [Pseudanabaena galeata UHCC 0370]
MIFNQWDRAIANIYPNLGIRIAAPSLGRAVANDRADVRKQNFQNGFKMASS